MCNIQSKLIFHAHHEVGFQKCVRVQAKVFCIFSRLTLFAAGLKIMAGCVFNTQKSLWFFWCLDRSYENRGHFGGLRVGGASKRVKCMLVRVWVWHCSVARSRCYRIYSTICLVQKKIYISFWKFSVYIIVCLRKLDPGNDLVFYCSLFIFVCFIVTWIIITTCEMRQLRS